MSETSESEVNIKELGEMYAEITIQFEAIPVKEPEVKEIIPDVPSPTHSERRKAYHYQKLLREYEVAVLEGINAKKNNFK
ncbi:unnamed protein product [Blepharisma stoltei]|uniref:Uncharacterized protein n=1 Tax=Blepharisma stoltei TaxID=1481888 RepID=A0AAU9JUF9_9CILI|nr:unnamed protein product [Blepharisma stoltei]